MAVAGHLDYHKMQPNLKLQATLYKGLKGIVDQEEEMDRMAIAHHIMSPRLASDLVILVFRLMMETSLEMDSGVSLASLRTSTSGRSHCLSWIYRLKVRSRRSGRSGPRMWHLHSRLAMTSQFSFGNRCMEIQKHVVRNGAIKHARTICL